MAKAPAKKKATAQPKRRPGRPSTYTQKVADEILRRMSMGETLYAICDEPAMPTRTAVFKWRQARPEFDTSYARAREDQMHAWADQVISFADNGVEDILRDGDGNPILKKNGDPQLYREHIDRTRLRIETRKWLMAKILPTVFGDRLNIDATHTIESKDDAEILMELRSELERAGMTAQDLVALLTEAAALQK